MIVGFLRGLPRQSTSFFCIDLEAVFLGSLDALRRDIINNSRLFADRFGVGVYPLAPCCVARLWGKVPPFCSEDPKVFVFERIAVGSDAPRTLEGGKRYFPASGKSQIPSSAKQTSERWEFSGCAQERTTATAAPMGMGIQLEFT